VDVCASLWKGSLDLQEENIRNRKMTKRENESGGSWENFDGDLGVNFIRASFVL
jgi:hypothetical protein